MNAAVCASCQAHRRKRTKAIAELVATEEKYGRNLSIVKEVGYAEYHTNFDVKLPFNCPFVLRYPKVEKPAKYRRLVLPTHLLHTYSQH